MGAKTCPHSTEIVFRNYEAKSVKVKNIQQSGLELEYEPGRELLSEKVAIDIYTNGECCAFLSGIWCRKVSDRQLLSENRTFSGSHVRECCLEYYHLTEEQNAELGKILKYG